MILTIDIGNTNICFGAQERNNFPLFFERIHTDRRKDTAFYAHILSEILALHHLAGPDFEGGILSCVVESLKETVQEAARQVLKREILTVSSELKLPFSFQVQDPKTVGADIICDIAGALALSAGPLMTFDMGTATVCSYISATRALETVYILPGVRTSLSSLSGNTSSLPDIALDEPRHIIGRNTVESLQSGILYGTAGLVDGLVKRVEKEVGSPCQVILTGGLSSFIAPYVLHPVLAEPTLLMKGLYEIYRLNA